jgi:hypothetical protein
MKGRVTRHGGRRLECIRDGLFDRRCKDLHMNDILGELSKWLALVHAKMGRLYLDLVAASHSVFQLDLKKNERAFK